MCTILIINVVYFIVVCQHLAVMNLECLTTVKVLLSKTYLTNSINKVCFISLLGLPSVVIAQWLSVSVLSVLLHVIKSPD